MSVIVSKENKQRLYDSYNATSTETTEGSDELESYENWIERQLLSRMDNAQLKGIRDRAKERFDEHGDKSAYWHYRQLMNELEQAGE